MNEPDHQLRRLFAEAPIVGPDEDFVAAVAVEVKQHRSQRPWRLALWVAAVPLLSVLLAQFAPAVARVASWGLSLLQLPEVATRAVEHGAGGMHVWLGLPAWLYLSLVVLAPLLAGAVWLLARRT